MHLQSQSFESLQNDALAVSSLTMLACASFNVSERFNSYTSLKDNHDFETHVQLDLVAAGKGRKRSRSRLF